MPKLNVFGQTDIGSIPPDQGGEITLLSQKLLDYLAFLDPTVQKQRLEGLARAGVIPTDKLEEAWNELATYEKSPLGLAVKQQSIESDFFRQQEAAWEKEVTDKTLSFMEFHGGIHPELNALTDKAAFDVNQQKEAALGGQYGLGDRPTMYKQPELPEVNPDQVNPFLASLSPNLKGFWSRNVPSLLSGVNAIRQEWWNIINTPAANEATRDVNRSDETRAAGGTVEPANPEGVTGEASVMKPPALDPIYSYLQNFNPYAEYLRNAPRARGEYPSLYQPPTVWR